MFPITEKYIEREYTIAGNHLMLTSEHTAKVIEQKARKVLGMLKSGVKFMPTQPDVLSILENHNTKKYSGEILFASLNSSSESWNPLNKRLPRLFLLLLTAITLFHIVLLLDNFSLRHRDYFS